jgi:hypothetical protein
MPNCRKVAYLISSDGLEQATWPTRLLTRLHLVRCENCRRYAAELAMMGLIGREALSTDSVDPKTVQRLEGLIMDYPTREHEDDKGDGSGDEGGLIH